jgi:hypothetical protein
MPAIRHQLLGACDIVSFKTKFLIADIGRVAAYVTLGSFLLFAAA